MPSLKDFKTQAVSGFAVVIAVTVGALLAVFIVERRTAEARERVLAGYAQDVLQASRVELNAERIVAAGRGYLLTGDAAHLGVVDEAEKALYEAFRRLERTATSPDGPRHLAAIDEATRTYLATLHALVDEARASSNRAAMTTAIEVRLVPKRIALDRRVGAFARYKQLLVEEANQEARAASSRVHRIVITLGLTAVSLAGILAWAIARRLDNLYRIQQREAERAQREAAAREELLGVVAHDLRNPLNAIVLKAGILRARSAEAETGRAAAAIERLGGRMATLINGLLDAASIQANRFSISSEQVRVTELLAALSETFAGVAAEKGLRLVLSRAPTDATLECDGDRLLQVLCNLLANAIKYSPSGGTVELRFARAGSVLRFEVLDEGPGVPAAHAPLLFERFWHDGGRRGTGLGLYICKGVVDAHRGRIWHENRSSGGSRFVVELPDPPRAATSNASVATDVSVIGRPRDCHPAS